MSEIRKNITLNKEVLKNSTAQWAPDMLFLARRLDLFEEGFAIENLLWKRLFNTNTTTPQSSNFCVRYPKFEAQYRLFTEPNAS